MNGKKAQTQIDKFREAAREFEACEDGDAFDAAVAKVAHSPKLSDAQIKEVAEKARKESKANK